MRIRSLIAVGALALAVLVPAVTAGADETDGLSRARHGTAEFRNVNKAGPDGYGLFKDVNGIACIDNPRVGGMGIHYVNATRVGDPRENAATPEALVYEPAPHGRLRLVAVEYIVTQAAWVAAGNTEPPSCSARSSRSRPARTAMGCRPSTSCTPGSGSTTRAGCSTSGTPRSPVPEPELRQPRPRPKAQRVSAIADTPCVVSHTTLDVSTASRRAHRVGLSMYQSCQSGDGSRSTDHGREWRGRPSPTRPRRRARRDAHRRGGPPNTTKPESTSPSIKAACDTHSACSSIGRDKSY